MAAGRSPYESVAIRTRGELDWTLRERDWTRPQGMRGQGLVNYASGYRLLEQQLERRALVREGKVGTWIFSFLLDLVAGYGERSWRSPRPTSGRRT